MNPIGAHPLTWIGRWTRAAGPGAIDHAAACGFASLIIPLRDAREIEATDIARRCAAAGLRPIGAITHPASADPAAEDPAIAAAGAARLLQAVALARDIGATQLGGIPHSAWGRAAGPVGARGRGHALAALARAAEAAAASGMRITLEAVNRFENALVNTAADGLALIDAVGAPNLLLHLDTHHMLIEEADPAAAIARAAPRLGYFEFSESHRGRLGTGNVDVPAMAQALVAAGYAGVVGFEAFSAAILEPGLAAQLCVWRDTYTDADAVARDARLMILRALGAAKEGG
jgi:D-psicose/D-tagatose/L-ribulose 3-epimerase